MDGDAAHRLVGIVSEQGGKTHTFEMSLFLPNTVDKAPVFLFINNRQPSLTDPTRKEKSGFWPAEQMIARGYGMATFHYGTIAPDDKDKFRTGAMQLYEAGGGHAHVGRGGRLGLGREPGDGLSGDRSPRRRRPGRRRRALARRQGGAMGRRRGSALRDGGVERVRRGRRRAEPARLRRDGRAHQHGLPALVHGRLQGLQRPRSRPADRPAHAAVADRAAGALRRQRRPGPLGRSTRRVPVARRVVAGLRAVRRCGDRRRRDAGAGDAAGRRPPRVSRSPRRPRSDAVRLGAFR